MVRPLPRRRKAAKTKRARAVKLLSEEALLDACEASALLGSMSPENWPSYAARWPALLAGTRIVRVKAGSRGRARWLKSSILRHIREELLTPELDAGEAGGGK